MKQGSAIIRKRKQRFFAFLLGIAMALQTILPVYAGARDITVTGSYGNFKWANIDLNDTFVVGDTIVAKKGEWTGSTVPSTTVSITYCIYNTTSQQYEATDTTDSGSNLTVKEVTKNDKSYRAWKVIYKYVGSGGELSLQFGNTDYKTVTFNYNYGTTPTTIDKYFVLNGENKFLIGDNFPAPTRQDYTLEGWYKDTTYEAEKKVISTTVLDGDITLYAHWTSSKTPATVTAPTLKADFDYNGTEQGLLATNGSTSAGTTLKYYATTFDEDPGANPALPDGATFNTTPPTGNNANAYYVWYKVEGNDTYAGVDPTYIGKVTIKQKDLTIKAKDQTVALNGSISTTVSNDTVEYDGLLNGHTVSDGITISTTQSTATAGTFNDVIEITLINDNLTIKDGNNNDVKGNYAIQDPGKGDLVVNTAALTVTAPTANNRNYDGTEKALVTGGGVTQAGKGKLQYAVTLAETVQPAAKDFSDTVPTGTDAKDYYVWYKGVSTDNSYTGTAVNGPIKVTISAGSIEAGDVTVPGNKEVDYNGSAQALITAGSTTKGTIKYAVTTTDSAPALDTAYTYTNTSLPTATDANTYYVWYKVFGGTNYNDTDAARVVSKIKPIDPNVTAPTKADSKYDGTQHAIISSLGSTSGGTIQYAIVKDSNTAPTTYSTYATLDDFPKQTDAGTYHIWYKVVGNTNYKNADPAEVTATISGADPSVTITGKTKLKYTGVAQALIETPTVTGGTVSFAATTTDSNTPPDDNEFTFTAASLPTGTNAATYYIWYKIAGADNYSDKEATKWGSVTIGKAPLTITAKGKTITYGDAAPALNSYELTYTGMVNNENGAQIFTSGAALTVACDYAQGNDVKEGGYAITVTKGADTDNGNYSVTVTNGTLTVNQKEVTITGVTASSKTYDSTTTTTAHITNAAVSGKYGDDDVTVTQGDADFSDKNAGTGKTVIFSNFSLSGAKAGNYKLKEQPANTTADILRKNVTVTVTAVNREYEKDNVNVALTAGSIEGKCVADYVDIDLSEASGKMADDKVGVNKAVTVTGVKLSGPDAENYLIETQPTGVTVTITKTGYTGEKTSSGSAKYGNSGTVDLTSKIATLSGAALGAPVVASDTNSVLSGAPTVSGNVLSFAFVNDAEKVGKTATVNVPVTCDDYSGFNIVVTLTVWNKDVQTVSFAVNPVEKTYGDAAFADAATTTGDGGITYQSSKDSVATVDATGKITIVGQGTCIITATAAETAAYKSNYAELSITVNKKNVTITGLGADDKVYDGTPAAAVSGTAAINGKVDGDDVSVSAGTASFADKKAGTAKTVTFSGYTLSGTKAANYDLTAQPAAVTASITAKPVTVTVTPTDRDYTKGDKTVNITAGTVNGAIEGDDVSVDISSATAEMADENAGAAKPVTVTGVKLSGADAANYQLSAQPAPTVNIAKIEQNVTFPELTEDTVKKHPNSDAFTFAAESDGDGAITYKSSDETKATVDANGKVTITATEPADIVITATAAETTNYKKGEAKYDLKISNEFTLTFVDTDNTVLSTITQNAGTDVVPPATPKKTGYTFSKWDKDVPAKMPMGDETFVARWTINRHTITFDTAGGSTVPAITQDYDTEITPPAAPTRTGYTFDGWDTVIPAKMPDNDMKITAKWKVNRYTITFTDTDGTTVLFKITQDYDTAITKPAAPEKEGYTFSAWDTAVPGKMPAEDMTIKAKWTVNKYTITFDTKDGTPVDPITADFGSAVTAPASPEKTGYTFDGWDIPVPATMPAKDMTITAKWKLNSYTITFDSNKGSKVDPITAEYMSAVKRPKNPTREGYIFLGWTPDVPSAMPAENITCVANWKKGTFTITFDTDGGSAIAPITQEYNSFVTPPADPTKANYTFKGWDKEIPGLMPGYDVTIKALWEGKTYTISFDSNGGSAVDPIVQGYDTGVTPPADPTRDGYTFAGWSPAVPDRMPDHDTLCVAQWTPVPETETTEETTTTTTTTPADVPTPEKGTTPHFTTVPTEPPAPEGVPTGPDDETPPDDPDDDVPPDDDTTYDDDDDPDDDKPKDPSETSVDDDTTPPDDDTPPDQLPPDNNTPPDDIPPSGDDGFDDDLPSDTTGPEGKVPKDVEDADEGDTVTIDMKDDPVLPKEVLESIKGKDVTIVLELENGLTWTINGLTVTDEELEDINFSVSFDGSGIPVEVVNLVTGERSTVFIHLEHDGPFGFDAVLTVNLDSKNAGYYANLFYYDAAEGDLDFVTAGIIRADGSVELNFKHASDYTIIIDDKPMGGYFEENGDNNPETGVALFGTAGVAAAAALMFFTRRKKK